MSSKLLEHKYLLSHLDLTWTNRMVICLFGFGVPWNLWGAKGAVGQESLRSFGLCQQRSKGRGHNILWRKNSFLLTTLPSLENSF